MRIDLIKQGHSGYYSSAAVYQPNQGQLRRTVTLVLLLLIVFLIGIATRAHAVDKPANCQVLKGGISQLGSSHDLDI